MIKTTMGRLLLEDALPDNLKQYAHAPLDKKAVMSLFKELAEKHPDKYRDVAHAMMQVGKDASFTSGGYSFGLNDLHTPPAALARRQHIQAEVDAILDSDMPEEEKEKRIITSVGKHAEPLEKEVYAHALSQGSPLAKQISSGAKGSPANLRSLRGGDLLYIDHNDQPIPMPVLHSYSEGLTPAEMFAGSFGARRGVVVLKLGTAEAGYFCLGQGTQVQMAGGSTKAIEQIQVGDMVIGANTAGITRPVRVTATFANGEKEVWRYKFRIGKARDGYIYLDATPDHFVLARKKAGRVGSRLGLTDPAPIKKPLKRATKGFGLTAVQGSEHLGGVSEKRALLLGLLIGNGSFCGHNVTLSTGDTAQIEELKPYMDELQLCLDKIKGHPVEYYLNDLNSVPRKVGCSELRHRVRIWLNELGLLGKKSPAKFIPQVVDTWDNASVAALIGGLFAANGCVTYSNNSTTPIIVLSMCAKQVVEKTRELLALRFGIHAPPVRVRLSASMSVGFANGRTVIPRSDVYTLAINDRGSVLRFAGMICMPGEKQQRLKDYLSQMAPAFRDNEFCYSFVEKTYLGAQPTFDIEVDHPDHLFVLANGAIVSNSKQLVNAAHRLVVTGKGDDVHHDPDAPRGLPVSIHDQDNEGAYLAHPVGGYERNTLLTPKVLQDLKSKGTEHLLVRSPMVGGPDDGGIYAMDAGVRERGGLPPIGEAVGITRPGHDGRRYPGRYLLG